MQLILSRYLLVREGGLCIISGDFSLQATLNLSVTAMYGDR
ncbi:hypothetical protein [Chamaesiphon sp. GL140_3_metabinner_50]|nr:hypothetical protein [Chamaesiphon sp. GL140_3_metabinner_50]